MNDRDEKTLSDPWMFFEPPEEDASNRQAMMTILPGSSAPLEPAAPPLAAIPIPAFPVPAIPIPVAKLDDTAPFRPLQRPPMALLCILHDGGDTGGEWIALRGSRYVIGRNDGDIRIPHDGQISGRQHAEIARTRTEAGANVWQLTDLGSTNGTFVRVSKLVLQPGGEFMVGRTRYRFEAGRGASEPAPPPPDIEGFTTMLPGAAAPGFAAGDPSPPELVEVLPGNDGARVALLREEYWIGRDPERCAVVPGNDAFVSPRHARLFKAEAGRWRVENAKSRNGLWHRLANPLAIEGTCQFQLGEQRFILKVLAAG